MRKKSVVFLILVLTVIVVLPIKIMGQEDSPFQVFQEVLFLINNYHIEEHEMNKLVQGAIRGMVNTLDPFSEYMTEDEYEEMQVEFEGHFGGIGIVITPDLTIVSPIKGTPGDRAGLKSGDKIIAIDGKPTEDMSQKKAVDMMRGEPGTPVDITIQREGVDKPLEIHIIRADIEVPYVEWEMKEDKIGYISIAQFVEGVGDKVAKAISELEDQGARALILDLRSNPGGLLNEAVNVSSNFLDNGEVVSVRQRYGPNESFKVNYSYQVTDLPLLVMINQGSASASEIVAGAIKDRDRGVLLGMKTFGKGTVQSVIPLSDGSALRLTTGRYYTPAGNFIHEKGIKPDIEVEYKEDYDGDNQLERAIDYIKRNILNEDLEKAGLRKAS